jgi:hypothetical protein
MPIEACGANPFGALPDSDEERPAVPLREPEARAALLHEHDPDVGIDLDVLSVGARASAGSTGVDAVLERVSVSTPGERARFTGELLAAGVELGTRNLDGSQGLGIGAGVVVAGFEATLKLGSETSVSFGASAGVGLHVSMGLRDADHDGKPALCARVVEVFTLAGCIELPF